MRKSNGGRAAFTLIELLVVMAIIGILVSLMLTALGAVRTSAKKTLAKDQCMQIKTAWTAYLNEYRKFPSFEITEMNKPAIEVLRGGIDKGQPGFEENPKKLIFMDFHKDTQSYADPWGSVYKVALDRNGENLVRVNGQEIRVNVAVWSLGPDQVENTKDDVVSWKR